MAHMYHGNEGKKRRHIYHTVQCSILQDNCLYLSPAMNHFDPFELLSGDWTLGVGIYRALQLYNRLPTTQYSTVQYKKRRVSIA